MSGISNIVAHGFGSWSTVNYVPTLGFGSSADIELAIGAATYVRSGIVGTAAYARTGIVGKAAETRTGIVGTAEVRRNE